MIVETSHKVQLKRERGTITYKLQWISMKTKEDKLGGYILAWFRHCTEQLIFVQGLLLKLLKI